MKYGDIKKIAKRIDKFIDKNRKYFTLPMNEIIALIKYEYPSCYKKYQGWEKTVFTICPQRGSKGDVLILKVGKEGTIKNDVRAWKRVPKKLRKKYFAKIHWHTKYCLLQEYGEKVKVKPKDVNRLKSIAAKYGLIDVKPKNIRKVNGALKIIDVNIFIKKGKYKTNRLAFVKDYIRMKLS